MTGRFRNRTRVMAEVVAEFLALGPEIVSGLRIAWNIGAHALNDLDS